MKDLWNDIKDGCISILLFYAGLFMLIFLCSCSATRKTEAHTTSIAHASTECTSRTKSQSIEDIYLQWAKSRKTDMHIHMRVYDTEKPPDNAGQYPLIADIELSHADSSEESAIDTTKTTKAVTEASTDSNNSVSIEQRDSATSTKAGENGLQIYAILATIITGLLAIFAWRQRKTKQS